jgi:hypothetical protein
MPYLLYTLADARDLVIVVWGALSILLTILVAGILLLVLIFARKGMKFLHTQVDERATKGLQRVLEISQSVRDRTATFPGAPGSTGGAGELVAAVRDLKEIEAPFRPRRKSWLPF